MEVNAKYGKRVVVSGGCLKAIGIGDPSVTASSTSSSNEGFGSGASSTAKTAAMDLDEYLELYLYIARKLERSSVDFGASFAHAVNQIMVSIAYGNVKPVNLSILGIAVSKAPLGTPPAGDRDDGFSVPPGDDNEEPPHDVDVDDSSIPF